MMTSHRLRTVRFRCGHWICACSCARYMSKPYQAAAAAMVPGSQHAAAKILAALGRGDP